MDWLGLITGAFKAIAALFGFWDKQQDIKAGVTKQETADLKATQDAEQKAAATDTAIDTDPSYAQRVRDRYTDTTDK